MSHKMIDKLLASYEYKHLSDTYKDAIARLKSLELPNSKQEEYQNTDFSDVFESVDSIAFEKIGIDYIENDDAHIITVRNNAEDADIDTSILSVKIVERENVGGEEDTISVISSVLADKSVLISLGDNIKFDKPIIISNQVGTVGSDLYSTNININVGVNSNVQIVVYEECVHATPLFIGRNSLKLAKNAKASFCHVVGANDAKSLSAIVKQEFMIAENADLQVFNLSLSGHKCRIESHIDIYGKDAHADIQGIAFLAGNQLLDNHIYINHLVGNSTSNQLFKYIIDGEAQGVFSGLINIVPDAQRVEAFQRNNNILLTDKAKMHTKPQLIIDADDVKCSHGATTGQIDEQALFYMRSRGIDEQEARAMLIDAFLDEVIVNIAVQQVREQVKSFTNKFFKN
ncbi:MAG: Fe-S cluster assembly protein SufD [Bacteroidales bacterium]